MAHWARILADETVPARTIVRDGQVAGNIVSWEQDGKRLVGYWIGKKYWGKGVATMALGEYLRLLETRPLYAHVAKHNVASIRVLEKCGFKTCVEETESLGAPSDSVDELIMKLSQH
jgi:RimJ/RimL family protein N-acetyltransferase